MMIRYSKMKIKSVNPNICLEKPVIRHCDNCCADEDKFCSFRTAARQVGRVNPNNIYVIVDGLHGDLPNDNGDYFEWENTLLASRDDGERAYQTWKDKPNLVNHDNDIVVGRILDVWPNFQTKAIEMLLETRKGAFRLAGRDLTRAILEGNVTEVSMGTGVDYSFCSECGNMAFTEGQWCKCLRYYKGKRHPDSGNFVYENNKAIYGLEESYIVMGLAADRDAKVRRVLAK